MQEINVNAIPINEVMADLGKTLGVEVDEHCNELSLTLPPSLGKGHISGIQFKNGLGLIQYDCKFHEDTEICFVKSNVHPLKFIYVMEGGLEHRFSNEDEVHQIDRYQYAIVASKEKNGHILKFEKDKVTSFSSIELERESFYKKLSCELKGVNSDLTEIFEDVQAENIFYFKGYFSLKIADTFKEMNSYEDRNFIRKLFLEGFTLQILAEEILQYEDSQKGEDEAQFLTMFELDAIKEAANYIENHISQELSVNLLAKEVGLNQNKLQFGFKRLYGTTVRTFIVDFRLRLVKTLLLTTNLQMGEISEKIGISSKSYFSKIFKERYGLSPKEFKQKQKP